MDFTMKLNGKTMYWSEKHQDWFIRVDDPGDLVTYGFIKESVKKILTKDIVEMTRQIIEEKYLKIIEEKGV